MLKSRAKRMKKSLNVAAIAVAAMMIASCDRIGIGGAGGVGGSKVDITKPVVVALLVPKGGALDQIGRSIEAGAQLAMAERNTGEIDLRVYETAGDPVRAAGLAQAAKAAGATLIIGPLTTEEVHAVDASVDLPVLSFSNNADATSTEAYILGTSFAAISDRIAAYTKAIGRDRVGIVAGDDKTGLQGASAMTAAAGDNGLAIVSSSVYPITVTDINAAAPAIAGQLKATQANSVFFTDTPTGGLPLITAALADQGVSSSTAQFLGLTRWDVPPTTLGLAQLQGGVFADNDPATSAAFDSRFLAANGYASHPLSGIGYDGVVAAISLVRDARKSRDTTPFDAKDIRGLTYQGAFGPFQFDNKNQARRNLAVMQVTGGSLRVVSPARR